MIDMELIIGIICTLSLSCTKWAKHRFSNHRKNKNSRMFKAVPGQNYVYDDRKLLTFVDINIKLNRAYDCSIPV